MFWEAFALVSMVWMTWAFSLAALVWGTNVANAQGRLRISQTLIGGAVAFLVLVPVVSKLLELVL